MAQQLRAVYAKSMSNIGYRVLLITKRKKNYMVKEYQI